MGINIDLADIDPVDENRHYDFGLDMDAAGDIVVLGSHIRDYKVLVAERHLSTNPLPKRNNGVVCGISGEGA